MRLYGYFRSTATWRVRIALGLKAVPYETVPMNLAKGISEQRSPEFAAKNPMKHVPVLELDIDGKTRLLAESMAILEHLEETVPNPPLLPQDPFLRARARQLALLIVSGIQPLQNTKVQEHLEDVLHQDASAWVRRWVTPGLESLEALAAETAGTYCIGEQITFAECCLVPQLAFARRFGLDLDAFPTLTRIDAACSEHPAFVQAHANQQIDSPILRASMR